MTEVANEQGRTTWTFWLVAVISLFWNAYGAYDYFMSKTGGDAYLRSVGMTEPQVAYFNAMPSWMTAVWAGGVWGAVLGSVLLLMRRRWALPVFVASFAGFLMSLVYAYGLSNGLAVNGPQVMVMQAVVAAGCAFFIWYAQLMVKRGVLS